MTALAALLSVALGCSEPNAQTVLRHLAAQRPPQVPGRDWQLTFEARGQALLFHAREKDSAWFERTLPPALTCEETERAAAVILWAWELTLPSPQTRAARQPLRAVGPVAPKPPEASPSVEVGVGAFALGDAAGLGAGATGFVSVRPFAGRWWLELPVLGHFSRAVTLAPGEIHWGRLSAGLGAGFALIDTPLLTVSAHAELVSGVIWLQATGFELTRTEASWDLAGEGGVRVRFALGPSFGLWTDLRYLVWARRHSALIDGVGSVGVPWGEAQLAVGLCWCPGERSVPLATSMRAP